MSPTPCHLCLSRHGAKKKKLFVSYLLPTCRPHPRWAPCCGSGWACCCCSPAPPRRPPPYHRAGGARCSRDPRPSGQRSHRRSASYHRPRTRNTAQTDNFITRPFLAIKDKFKWLEFPSSMNCPWMLNCFNELIFYANDPRVDIEQQVGSVFMKLFVPEDGRFSSAPSWRNHLCWTEAGIYHTCGQTVSHNPENGTTIYRIKLRYYC